MRGLDDPYVPVALPPGRHWYVIGMSDVDKGADFHMTEAGPYASRAEALKALRFYELVLHDFLEPMETIGLEFRVFEVEVGHSLPPDPGPIVMIARTSYLELPVAGAFRNMDQAMWVYGLVLYLVEARLAYLDEELFHTLQVDVEEDYVLERGAKVWLRIARTESARASEDPDR